MTTEKKTDADNAGKAAADKVGDQKQAVVNEVAKDLAKDAVKAEAQLSTGNESDVIETNRWLGSDEMNGWEDYLDHSPEQLTKEVAKDGPVPEEKVAGLLILERNGRNRTEYVKLLMKRLGIKDLTKELPQAGGPGYTNDTTNLSEL